MCLRQWPQKHFLRFWHSLFYNSHFMHVINKSVIIFNYTTTEKDCIKMNHFFRKSLSGHNTRYIAYPQKALELTKCLKNPDYLQTDQEFDRYDYRQYN